MEPRNNCSTRVETVTKMLFQKKSPICASDQASAKLASDQIWGSDQALAKSSSVVLKAV